MDGGACINYRITTDPPTPATIASSSPATVTGLQLTSAYAVEVRAVNTAGASSAAAFVLGEGETLSLDELTPELRGEGPEVFSGACAALPEPADLAMLERQQLVKVWQEQGGRRVPMAQALGVSRSTLYRKLKAHGLI